MRGSLENGWPIRLLFLSILALSITVCVSGCGSGSGASDMPDVSPSAAAEQAIELLDKNGSGSLDEQELAACPGILAMREQYDADGNREISEEELSARFEAIYRGGTSWVSATCLLLQGNRPLGGAKVRFVPEAFLGDALPPATGTTDSQGRVTPAVADDQLPPEFKGAQAMRLGIYRVEVEHPSIKQPHKALGCEISNLVRGGTEPVLRL
jgi:hypothetical protein